MLPLLRYLASLLGRLVLSLRYRVRVHGTEPLRGLKGGTIVLPNHPGYIDPPLVLTSLWPYLQPRPTLYEGNFKNPVLYPFMLLLDALQVPDLDRPSAEARAKAEAAIQGVIEGLKKGETHILWPAGRVQYDRVERLGATQALTDVLKAVPDANVVLVRTRGVWGSMFTTAYTGRRAQLGRRLKEGVLALLGNLLFFAPRRNVDVTVEVLDRSQLPELQRDKVNRFFEEWYNADGPEQPTFVPYHFAFGPREYEFPPPDGLAQVDFSRVKPETKAEVGRLVAEKIGRALADQEQAPDTTLEELGLSSLDAADLTLKAEQHFGFAGDLTPTTLGQLWALAQGLIDKEPPKPPPPAWFRPPSGSDATEVKGDTLAEAFVARALESRNDVAAADDRSGVLTYEKMLVGALVMARRFAELPGDNVGLMLPASVGNDVAFMALHLAGKLPVLLNWTTGPGNLAHAARLTGLRHVVTSKAFIDRAHVVVEGTEYVYLEELRQKVGRVELLRTLLTVRLFPDSVRRRVPKADPDGPAVVLFTSGSEKAPKAVPLTHTNILTNVRAFLPCLGLSRRDALLGFLPAFHSFGMTATTVMPLVAGLRVLRHPDPTDAGSLARKVAAYKPTLLAGTPTFVSYILDRAGPGDLASLRCVFVGAEKCPESVFVRCKQAAPAAEVIEGYGITECSPVVSVNRPGASRPGTVGQPIPGVEVLVVDLDTDEALPTGHMGMLLVSGPTVFPGYLGSDQSPFVERDGKRWYVTGDLAELDADDTIRLCGRLKRFLKAGGEMISLPALEEPFALLYPPTQDGPRVAVEGVETEGGRRIVLFCTEPLSLGEANAILQEEGFRGVMRLDEVRHTDAIPVLGTGKTDYKVLRARLAAGVEPAGRPA